MQFRIRSVQKNHAPFAKQRARRSGRMPCPASRPADKTRAKIAPPQNLPADERLPPQPAEFRLPDAHRSPERPNSVAGGSERAQKAVGARHRHVIHFGKIVIVGGQPEHRHRVNACRSGLLRQLDRGQSLIDQNIGPPKRPTCCPVTTAAAPLRRRSRLARVCGEASQDLFWRSRIAPTRSRRDESYCKAAQPPLSSIR